MEFLSVVAPMAVQNQQAVRAHSTLLCMRVKVLQPLQSKLICRPAVGTGLNLPIVRHSCVPARYQDLFSKDDEGRDSPSRSTYALDDRDPFLVAWLYLLRVGSLLRGCKDHLAFDYAHHEPRFIEVVCVFIQNAVLLLCLPHELEPARSNACIFVQSSLVIVWMATSKLDLLGTRLEPVYPVLANRSFTARSK